MGETRISKVTTAEEAAALLEEHDYHVYSYTRSLNGVRPVDQFSSCAIANDLSGFNSQTEADLAALLEAAAKVVRYKHVASMAAFDELAAVVERVKENKK